MSSEKLVHLAVRFISAKTTPVIVGLASAVLASVFLPSDYGRGLSADPAAEAQEAYRSLMDELTERAWSRTAAAPLVLNFPDSASVRRLPRTLKRNLFAPIKGEVSRTHGVRARRNAQSTPRLPRLSGVFIDGFSKHAIIAGNAVTEGDTVMGYTVIEIAPAWVVIQRGGAKHKLVLGGNP